MTPMERKSVREAMTEAMDYYPGRDEECDPRRDALMVAKFRIRVRLKRGLTINQATWHLQCCIYDTRMDDERDAMGVA